MQMVQAGQNYAKLGGQYTKEMRFPHGKVSDFALPPPPLAMKCTCVTRQRVFPQKSRLNNQTFRPTSC